MNEQTLRWVRYWVVLAAAAISGAVWYYASVAFYTPDVDDGVVKQDSLSGQSFNTGSIYNARDINPFVPYLVGFDALGEHGVSSKNRAYVQDAVINYVLYKEKSPNAKISYVKDSFNQQLPILIRSVTYDFQFGINDGNVHTVEVVSNEIDDKMTVTIYDNSDTRVFKRTFTIY